MMHAVFHPLVQSLHTCNHDFASYEQCFSLSADFCNANMLCMSIPVHLGIQIAADLVQKVDTYRREPSLGYHP